MKQNSPSLSLLPFLCLAAAVFPSQPSFAAGAAALRLLSGAGVAALPGSGGGEDPEHVFKLVLVGAPGAGKTALIRRYTTGGFDKRYTSTSEDAAGRHATKHLTMDGQRVRLDLHDTPGAARSLLKTDAVRRWILSSTLYGEIDTASTAPFK